MTACTHPAPRTPPFRKTTGGTGVSPVRWWVLLLAGSCLVLGSCKAGGDESEVDELRRQRETLLDENDALHARLNEAEAKLAELSRTLEAAGGDNRDEIVAALPRCAGITIGRVSEPVDTDDQPGADAVRVYVSPFDGRQRFVQIAGWLTLEADLIPTLDPSSPRRAAEGPRRLGRLTLGPSELREAYRSSALGTHYTATLPITDRPNAPIDGTLVLSASFRDAITGQTFTTTRTEEGAW